LRVMKSARIVNVESVSSYIKNSLNESSQKSLINNIYTFIKDPLPEEFDLEHVLQVVRDTVPEHLVYGLESIYIGQFEELTSKDMNAVYKDGAIYATNEQSNEDDLIEDIVHEIAHLVEERLGEQIYDDRSIVDEFLGKRQRFREIMKSEGHDIPSEYYYDLEYDKKFDEFLYKTVGYEKLTYLTMGLFVSPYGATSLREYFANAFQHYFLGEINYVKKISPSVFQKIESLTFQKHDTGLEE